MKKRGQDINEKQEVEEQEVEEHLKVDEMEAEVQERKE